LTLLLAWGCGTEAQPQDDPRGLIVTAEDGVGQLAGLALIEVTDAPSEIFEPLITGPTTTPSDARTWLYKHATGGEITVTLTTYASTAGALATFNGWFAYYGFPAAAERTPVDLGESAERIDLEWPALHALIVREGKRFVLVEADAAIDAAIRAGAMQSLAERALEHDLSEVGAGS